nr:Orn DAP Arg decarboxylase 2 domain containing protein [Haemonchus contortus]
MKGAVYQHDGTLEVEDYARKIAAGYDIEPFYAVKCNPDLNILKTLSAHGACFDCASLQEMDTILSNGLARGDEIILAHPVKSRRCIEYAIRNGVTSMTLDSVEELRKIASITSEAKLILRIKVTGFVSLVDLNKKFGADETTSKLILHEAVRLGVKIHGISFHIGSGVENCRPLALSLANARKLIDYGRMLGHPIDILDIGGGFMATTSREFFKRRDGFMRADIWGPTCCSFDIIESDRRISTVHEGDWILYPQCGAYSTCLSTNFNGFYPPGILYMSFAQRKALKSMMKDEEKSEAEQKAEEQESLGMSKEKADKLLSSKPTWADFKTTHGRQIARRVAKRCNDVFVKGVDKCQNLMSSVKDKCYETLPWYLMFFVCPKLNAEEACNVLQRRLQSIDACKKYMADARMSNSMEGDMNDVVNLTNILDTELQVNLHMMLVEMPRIENVFQVSQLKMAVSIGTNYVKARGTVAPEALQ